MRRWLPLVVFTMLITGCEQQPMPTEVVRSAIVTQPIPAAPLALIYPGEVRARYEPDLAFRIPGKVTERLVDVGDKVKKDQLLATLDPQDMRLQRQAAEAQVAAAQAAFNLAKAESNRYEILFKRELASRSQYDNVQSNLKAASAQLKQAQAELEVAGNQLQYASLKAPADGVITQRAIEVGQVVAAGQPAFTLAVEGEREVAIGIAEQAIETIKVGQAVDIKLWAQGDQAFRGVIREIAPAADSASRTYAARITLNDATRAELGQSAQVIISQDKTVPLAIPMTAVTADQGQPYVWVVEPASSTVTKRKVEIGPFGKNQVPILQGLEPSDWVVVSGAHVLLEGQEVRAVDRENRAVVLGAKE